MPTWESSCRQLKKSTILSVTEAAASVIDALSACGWDTEVSSTSRGLKVAATRAKSYSASLEPLGAVGRGLLGGWDLLNKRPAGVQPGGVVVAAYSFGCTVWILDSGIGTVVDASITEEVDPEGESVPDRGIFRLPSHIDDGDVAGLIPDSLTRAEALRAVA